MKIYQIVGKCYGKSIKNEAEKIIVTPWNRINTPVPKIPNFKVAEDTGKENCIK